MRSILILPAVYTLIRSLEDLGLYNFFNLIFYICKEILLFNNKALNCSNLCICIFISYWFFLFFFFFYFLFLKKHTFHINLRIFPLLIIVGLTVELISNLLTSIALLFL